MPDYFSTDETKTGLYTQLPTHLLQLYGIFFSVLKLPPNSRDLSILIYLLRLEYSVCNRKLFGQDFFV